MMHGNLKSPTSKPRFFYLATELLVVFLFLLAFVIYNLMKVGAWNVPADQIWLLLVIVLVIGLLKVHDAMTKAWILCSLGEMEEQLRLITRLVTPLVENKDSQEPEEDLEVLD